MTAPSVRRIAGANAIGYAVSLIVSFLQAPFLIRHLGDDRYGLWTLIGLTTGYYGLLDFGVRGGVGYFIARARAESDHVRLREITSSAFGFLLLTGTAVALIGALGIQSFPAFFKVKPQFQIESTRALWIAVFTMAVGFPLDVFGAILNGCRRSELTSVAETSTRIGSMLLIFAILPVANRLDVLAAITLSAKAIVWIITFVAATRVEKEWQISRRYFSLARVREVLRYGVHTFTGNVAGTIVEKADTVVVAANLGAHRVTGYVIGQSLAAYLGGAVNSLTLALTPFFADSSARGESDTTKRLFLSGTRAAALMTMIISSGLLAFGSSFLGLWIGTRFVAGALVDRSDVVLFLLVVGFAPRFIFSAGHQYLFGTNKHLFLSRAIAIEGVVNLTLSLVLVRYVGLAGVALATLIPAVIIHGFWVPRYIARAIDVPLRTIFRQSIGGSVFVGATLFCLGVILQNVAPAVSWSVFFAEVLACLLLVSPLAWRFVLNELERRTLWVKVASRLNL
jgi:O-antigen/teichoic acid export membrane protein